MEGEVPNNGTSTSGEGVVVDLRSHFKPFENPNPTVLDRLGNNLDSLEKVTLERALGTVRPVPLPWPCAAEQLRGGLFPGLHILVSNTGIGKTTWAIQVGLHAAQAGHPVGYVSTEIKADQMLARLIGERCTVPWSDLFLGAMGPERTKQVFEQARALPDIPFFLAKNVSQGWPITQLPEVAKELQEAGSEQTGLIVLDYLQMIGNGDTKAETRQRISSITNFIHDVAEEYKVAILAISSTGRANYAQSDLIKNAGISFLGGGTNEKRVIQNTDAIVGLGKESGDIEYSADSVSVLLKAGWDANDSLENPQRGGNQMIVFATPKMRVGVPSWCELRSTGYRFDSPQAVESNCAVGCSQTLHQHLEETNAPKRVGRPPFTEEDEQAKVEQLRSEVLACIQRHAPQGVKTSTVIAELGKQEKKVRDVIRDLKSENLIEDKGTKNGPRLLPVANHQGDLFTPNLDGL